MGAISRREFFMACGFAGAASVVSLMSGCNNNEAGTGGTYTFDVVSGAILVESDPKTGTYKYEKRCTACGWESKSPTTVKNGKSVNDSFVCPQCHFKQIVVINVSRS